MNSYIQSSGTPSRYWQRHCTRVCTYGMVLNVILFGYSFAATQDTGRPHGTLANNALYFLSDCQEPLFVETLWNKTYRNAEGRDSLFTDMLRQKPSWVFLLGDLVSSGRNSKEWRPIDTLLSRLSGMGARAYAIPGNHEYIFNAAKGIANFKTRFPADPVTGYCVTADSIVLVMLNSNFSELNHDEVLLQRQWYQRTMDSLEKDPSVKAIAVCTHHAPYTNSTVVGPSKETIDQFGPLFFSSSKAKLFLSGHSHNVEFFEPKPGKFFLVLGGGGGLAQPLLPAQKARIVDLIKQDKKPLYFYIILRREGGALVVKSRGVGRDFSVFKDLEIAKIPGVQ
jgi:predicted MPP superfamily phosphohydrolase